MRQLKAIITVVLFLCNQFHRTLSLPVTSKALDNNSDQLIWQTAWYAKYLNEAKQETPFTSDAKKITAKSIFITPNFQQNTSHCPPGYKIDDNGKCIKIVSINQDEILVTRLQSLYPHHLTTDDTTSLDYDYNFEEEDSQEPTHYNLPLVPILNDNDTSIYTINEPLTLSSSTVQYEVELDEYSFRDSNDTENSENVSSLAETTVTNDQDELVMNNDSNSARIDPDDEAQNATLYDQANDFIERTTVAGNSFDLDWLSNETRVDERNINLDQDDMTTTAENLTFFEQVETTSPETTLLDMQTTVFKSSHAADQFDGEDDNYTTTTPTSESEVIKAQSPTEKTINSDTTAIHLDDYFDTILLNDSLLIDESTLFENASDSDYDVTTLMTSHLSNVNVEVEQTTEEDERQENQNLPSTDSENKTVVDETIASSTSATTTARIEIDSTSAQNLFPYENRIINHDQQNWDLENGEAANKFVYHHLSATESSLSDGNTNVLITPTTIVRFPDEGENEAGSKHRFRFPDESIVKSPPATAINFSWPKENIGQTDGGHTNIRTYPLMQFWLDQPLINDFSRGNSRAPGNFNRKVLFRRN